MASLLMKEENDVLDRKSLCLYVTESFINEKIRLKKTNGVGCTVVVFIVGEILPKCNHKSTIRPNSAHTVTSKEPYRAHSQLGLVIGWLLTSHLGDFEWFSLGMDCLGIRNQSIS